MSVGDISGSLLTVGAGRGGSGLTSGDRLGDIVTTMPVGEVVVADRLAPVKSCGRVDRCRSRTVTQFLRTESGRPGEDQVHQRAGRRARPADFLVSGDKDLTALSEILPPARTPAAFLEALATDPEG
jgi:hypothetical protein